MEMGCLTFRTTASIVTSRNYESHRAGSYVPTTHTSTSRRSHVLSVKSSSVIKPHSISSNWDVDVSNYEAPTWWPRVEELDSTNMLLRQRIVFLGSQVDDLSADFVISQLLLLDQQDSTKDITLFINSPGGSVTAGMGIYDAMKMCKADISTVCVGLAASMGAFILACGTKGKRLCMPNCRVMIHQARGPTEGSATEMAIRVRETMYLGGKLNRILARVSGKTFEQLEEDTRHDYFMNSWEAVEYGLADRVIDDGKPGLVAPIPEAGPPPRARVFELFKGDGDWKGKQNLPSEEKFLLK